MLLMMKSSLVRECHELQEEARDNARARHLLAARRWQRRAESAPAGPARPRIRFDKTNHPPLRQGGGAELCPRLTGSGVRGSGRQGGAVHRWPPTPAGAHASPISSRVAPGQGRPADASRPRRPPPPHLRGGGVDATTSFGARLIQVPETVAMPSYGPS